MSGRVKSINPALSALARMSVPFVGLGRAAFSGRPGTPSAPGGSAATVAQPLRDRRGVTSSEYAILAVGVVLVVGAAVVTLGDPTRGAFAVMGNSIISTQASLAASAR